MDHLSTVFDLASLVKYLVFLGSSLGVWLIAFAIYQWVTPVDELKEIKNGNVAVAINFLAVAVALALPIQSLGHSTFDLLTLAIWGLIGGLSQIVLHFVARFAFKGVYDKVQSGDVAASLAMSAVVLVVGLLNAASLSF